LIYEKLEKWEAAEHWLKTAAWRYDKILLANDGYFHVDSNDYAKELAADLERVQKRDRSQQPGLSWIVRKERERLSKYCSFWGAPAPELKEEEPSESTDWQQEFDKRWKEMTQATLRTDRKGKLR
jgi:hypothetical protein